MNTTATRPQRTATESVSGELHIVEQLTLLPAADTPARFRLSKDTRERGLRHVAEIRRMLAERAERADRATASVDNVQPLHDRHEHAA